MNESAKNKGKDNHRTMETIGASNCQANMTFYLVDTKLQAGMTLKGTNPNSSDFRQGDKTLITKQLMP